VGRDDQKLMRNAEFAQDCDGFFQDGKVRLTATQYPYERLGSAGPLTRSGWLLLGTRQDGGLRDSTCNRLPP